MQKLSAAIRAGVSISGSADARSLLASLPPGFVASLGLPPLEQLQESLEEMGRLSLAMGGHKESVDWLKTKKGVTKKVLLDVRREFKQTHPHLTPGRYQLWGVSLIALASVMTEVLVVVQVFEKLHERCEEYANSDASHKELLGGVPDDLLECNEAATACILSIAALTVLVWKVVSEDGTWASKECLGRALEKLKRSHCKLRESLQSFGSDLCVSRIEVDGQSYASAHRAVFDISGHAIDSIALARTDLGKSIFKLPGEMLAPKAVASDCQAIATALLSIPLTEFPRLAAELDCEVSLAAQRRAANSTERRIDQAVTNGPCKPKWFRWNGATHPVPGVRFRMLACIWEKRSLSDDELGKAVWGEEWDEARMSTTVNRLNNDLTSTPWRLRRKDGQATLHNDSQSTHTL